MGVSDLFQEYSGCAIVAAIVVTIVALVISTRYSIRNLLNLRSSYFKPVETRQEAEEQNREIHNDAAGHDGDDEAEAEDDIIDNLMTTSLSPRYPDPVDYCEHIQGEIKRVQQSVATKTIAKDLSDQQLEEEREVQRKQLADIFRLMQEQQEKFGIQSMEDMQEQMRLYAV